MSDRSVGARDPIVVGADAGVHACPPVADDTGTSSQAPGQRRWARAMAVAIVVVFAVGVVAGVWFEASISGYPQEEPLWQQLAFLAGFGWFALLGAFLVARQPSNVMGWLLASVAVSLAVFGGMHSYAAYQVLERGREPDLLLSLMAWPNTWYWYLTISIYFLYIPILFPNGRLLSRRWRPVLWAGTFAVVGMCTLGAVAERIGFQVTGGDGTSEVSIANPLGVEGLAHVEQLPAMGFFSLLLFAVVFAAFASLFVRFRRSRGDERQQIKWLVLAVALLPVSLVLDLVGSGVTERLQGIGFVAAINGIPLAIGLAVLRYRLYDIDRILNRAAVYTLLTVTLVGLYAVSVIGLQNLFQPLLGNSDLIVAASTLAVAAASVPVRSRIQLFVDRRFNRARYDAVRTVETFANGLRDAVHLDDVVDGLNATAATVLQPERVGVWLRAGRG